MSMLDHLTLRATQRAEYLADREAACAASTEAAVGLMDRLLTTDSVAVTLRRKANNAALTGPRNARKADAGTDDRRPHARRRGDGRRTGKPDRRRTRRRAKQGGPENRPRGLRRLML
ncbi:hypothetical protein [Streptomyces sp. NPDC058424]|uniref:hypothetical protein n=1 Tax=Streptomyces sp. NPDC058424 TaxID=3346491 RepID=UPI003648413A